MNHSGPLRQLPLACLIAAIGLLPGYAGAQAESHTSSSASSAATPSAAPSMEEMANKANNPLSDVWLMLVENDTSILGGDDVPGNEIMNVTLIEPVMPVPVFDQQWNLIFRPVIPIVSAPIDEDAGKLFGRSNAEIAASPALAAIASDIYGGRTSGLGDSLLLTLLGPNRNDGFVWGGGVTQIFPTATDDVLGQEKWQAGPAALALRLGKEHGGLGIENWNFGVLAQQWWSYAGDDDRDSTSQANIQYFINWKLNATQLIGMTPSITVDWKADSGNKLSFPIGLGTIGMFRLGGIPVRWGVEAQYFVAQRDDSGPAWNFKVFFAPILLNPLK